MVNWKPCPEGECISNYMNVETGEHYPCPHTSQTPLFCAWPAGVTGGGRLIPCRKTWGHAGRCEPVE